MVTNRIGAYLGASGSMPRDLLGAPKCDGREGEPDSGHLARPYSLIQ